jgi:hypothetical protein
VFVLLTCGHITANYLAVSSLQFLHVNPFRLDLLIDSVSNKQSISVAQINGREPIWPHDILRHLRRFPRLRLGVNPNGNVLKGEGPLLLGNNCAAFEEGITSRGVVEAYYVLRTKSGVGFDEFIAKCQAAGFDFDRISLCVEEFSYAAKH